MSNQVTKFCVSHVTCKVAAYGLGKFVDFWNKHPVPSKFISNSVSFINIQQNLEQKVPLKVLNLACTIFLAI